MLIAYIQNSINASCFSKIAPAYCFELFGHLYKTINRKIARKYLVYASKHLMMTYLII